MCVTHVPWCMPGSLTSGFLSCQWREKRSRHSRRMRNPQFYESGKRSMSHPKCEVWSWLFEVNQSNYMYRLNTDSIIACHSTVRNIVSYSMNRFKATPNYTFEEIQNKTNKWKMALRARTSHISLQWRHNANDGVSNHQLHDYLLDRSFRCRSKKTSKLRVIGLCEGKSPVTGEFPAQRASDAESVSIWWRLMWKCDKMRAPMSF